MCSIEMIHTVYRHFSAHSGFYQLIDYIDSNRFSLTVHSVPNETKTTFFPIRTLHRLLRLYMRHKGCYAYGFSDLTAEINVFYNLHKKKTDIVHYLDGEHSLYFLPFLTRIFCNLKHSPIIIATFHQPPQLLQKFVKKHTLNALDHIIVLSPEQQSFLSKILPNEKISLIEHGVDTIYFRPNIKQRLENTRLKCLSVGSWLRDYHMVRQVSKKLTEIDFHIVSSDVRPFTAENVFFYSNVSDDELLKLYQECDLLFLPLIEATANNVILEAIACGLPVITSKLTSVEHYLSGKESIFVKHNSERFIEALRTVNSDRKRLYEMSQAARNHAKLLSWPLIAHKYELLYEHLANRHLTSTVSN